ncbi:hypothetical protein MFM001_45860 [Mycobacterium sp. MFM001]|nr:hypothetical protein MFM001_45860 [Mycobacterium sp. MFM001]
MFADEQLVEFLGRAGHRVGHHDQPPAVEQRTEDLPHREVEGQRVTLRPYLPGQFQVGVQSFQQLHDVVVGDAHTLGHTGGAGCVYEVSDFVRYRCRERSAGLGIHNRIIDIDDQ